MYNFKKVKGETKLSYRHKNFHLDKPDRLSRIRRKTSRFFNDNDSDSDGEDCTTNREEIKKKIEDMKESLKVIKQQNGNLLSHNGEIKRKLIHLKTARDEKLQKSLHVLTDLLIGRGETKRKYDQLFGAFEKGEGLCKRGLKEKEVRMIIESNNEKDNTETEERVEKLYDIYKNNLPEEATGQLDFNNNNFIIKEVDDYQEEGFKIIKSPSKSIRSNSLHSGFKSFINMSIFNPSVNRSGVDKSEKNVIENSLGNLSSFHFSDGGSRMDTDSLLGSINSNNLGGINKKYGI